VPATVLGTLAAVYDGTVFSAIVNGIGLATISLPGVFVGTPLVCLAQFRLRLPPLADYVPFDQHPLENLRLLILPAIALSYSAVDCPRGSSEPKWGHARNVPCFAAPGRGDIVLPFDE
jgi:ABC-type dipeptide/oligopeptide/nickel transport system permease component